MADFMFALPKTSVLFFEPSGEFHCKLIEFVANFGLRSSVIWGAVFGHCLLVFTKTRDLKVLSGMRNLYLIFAVLLPLGIAVVSTATGFVVYSEPKRQCVHRISTNVLDYQFLFISILPIFSAIALSFILLLSNNLRTEMSYR